MKTILVTGGAGFIGSNFIRYLLENVQSTFIINLDKLTYAGNLQNLSDIEELYISQYKFIQGSICNYELLDCIFNEFKPRYVINFAAETHVDRSILNQDAFISTNIQGTATLLNIAKKHWEQKYKGKLFLQVSTDEVYGSLPIDDKTLRFTENTPISPRSPYAASKAAADHLVMSFFYTYKFPAVISRCSNNFGPFQFPEKLIPLMVNNALNNKELPVYGDGLNVRDWIYVEDHCAALCKIIEHAKHGDVYNIGADNEIPNIEIVKMILSLLDKPHSLIKYVKDRLGHDRRYAIDSTKINTQLNWQAVHKFETALEHTVKWYIENNDWVKNIITGDYLKYYDSVYNNR